MVLVGLLGQKPILVKKQSLIFINGVISCLSKSHLLEKLGGGREGGRNPTKILECERKEHDVSEIFCGLSWSSGFLIYC